MGDLLRRRLMIVSKSEPATRFAFGTFTPESNLRSVTLPDLKGKNSFLIHPISDITISNRVQYGGFTLRNQCKFCRSTNTGKNAWSNKYTNNFSTGVASNSLSFNSSTGVVSILTGADINGGGYFLAGVTYAYAGWIEDGTAQTGDFVTGHLTPASNSQTCTFSDLVGKNCFIVWKDQDSYSSSVSSHVMDIVYKDRLLTCAAVRTNGGWYLGDPSPFTAYGTGTNSQVTYTAATKTLKTTNTSYSNGRGYYVGGEPYYYAGWYVE